MPHSDFLFAVKLAGDSPFDAMLGEVAASLLGHLGYAGGTTDELLGGLHEALARLTAGAVRRCDVHFRVEAGHLLIVVSNEGGGEWRATRPLPIR